jgi:mono/diheme cytochrome c family protein
MGNVAGDGRLVRSVGVWAAWPIADGSAYSRTVTQVPEYLLERSRARRAALGLGGDAPTTSGDGGDGDGGASGDSGGGGGTATATATAPARTEAQASAPAQAPAPSAPAAPAPPAAPLPDYVRDPGPKSGIPYWMMPVLLMLPLWGIVYLGAFGTVQQQELTGMALGAQVYQRSCQSCHGPRGEGAVGPKLAGGEAKATFPNEAEHIAWIESGSGTKKGQPYGDANRPGGQKIATSGGMPGFAGQLRPNEIAAVVLYEREGLQ